MKLYEAKYARISDWTAVKEAAFSLVLCSAFLVLPAASRGQQSGGRSSSETARADGPNALADRRPSNTPATSPMLNPSLNDAYPVDPATGGASPVVETSGPLHTCDDGISAAMEVDGMGMPCWANIRTVDHWNSMMIPEGLSFHGTQRVDRPTGGGTNFAYTAGGFSGFGTPDGSAVKLYGGLAAGAVTVQKERWQMSLEDAGGLGDQQLGGAHLAGINRFAWRGTGELSERLSWQGNATNTFGTDALREAAPLDYRMIGQAEAPASDTTTYGLHAGNVTDLEEGVKMRFAQSERSTWDLSGSGVYRHYSDDGFSSNTITAQAEYLHAMTRNVAVGFFAQGARQMGLVTCDIGGGGSRLLWQWSSSSSINVSGGLNGASAACGNRLQFTGNAALYHSVSRHTDLYASGDRGLSDGALERPIFLNTASVGLRHTFGRQVASRLSATALQGVDPNGLNGFRNQSLHGSFVEVGLRYPLGFGFSQESDFRHYAFSGTSVEPDRSLVLFTVWWSSGRGREPGSR